MNRELSVTGHLNSWSLLLACFLIVFAGCSNSKERDSVPQEPDFYKIGHRGTRGLMPENTVPAMIKGIEAGANTLEFDVHITRDGRVIVYHDATVNPAYTSLPGKEITDDNRDQYTFYQMDYDQIRQFEVGKNKKDFEDQAPVNSTIPLLTTMIDSVESYTQAENIKPVHYLLEIKSSADTDGKEQPAPEEYVNILMNTLKSYRAKLGDRLVIQSFDMRPLKIIHRDYPSISLGYLTGDKSKSIEQTVEELGFAPQFFNPYQGIVTAELLDGSHARNIKVCPWTVNKKEAINNLKNLGVDGLITDYPNRL